MASKCNSAQTIWAISSSPGCSSRNSSPPTAARIVNLSSDGHRLSDVDLDDPNWEHRDYDKFVAYGASKTANVLHMVELDRRLRDRGVRAYAVHPGVVATSLARHMTRDDFRTLGQMSLPRTDPGTKTIDVRRDFTTARAGRGHSGVGVGEPGLGGRRVGVPRGLRGCGDDVLAVRRRPAACASTLWELSEDLCGSEPAS